jgi:type I restriction enzyme S subunit
MSWKNEKLTEICTVTTGKWDANHASEKGEFRFYTCASKFLLCNTKRYDGKNIILPGNGANVGDVYFYDGAFDAYQRTYVLSDIKIIPEYLYYYLQSNWEETNRFKQYGSATNFLKISNFKDFNVSYPPLQIQQKIVEKLDAIFAEIDKATAAVETNINNAEALFQSYLNEVFESSRDGIESEKLSKVCFYDKNQGIHKNLPYIGMESIESNTAKLISSNELNTDVKSSTFKFTEEHLLYGRLRPYLNKVFLPNFTGHCSTEIFPIKPKKIITREFLKYWFIRIKTVNEINATCTGSRMPRANMNSVMNFEIILPPISVQKLLVKKIDSLNFETNRIKKSCQAKIDELKYFKQSILKQAFNGELVKAA